MDLGKDQTYTSIWCWWLLIRYKREQIKEKCSFQEWKWEHFVAIVRVWRAIANKIEASQEICFCGAKIIQASLQIIKWYVCIYNECLEGLGREIGNKLH